MEGNPYHLPIFSPKELSCTAHFPKLILALATAILPPRFAWMSLPDSGRLRIGDLEVFPKLGSSPVAITGALEGGSQSSANESEGFGA